MKKIKLCYILLIPLFLIGCSKNNINQSNINKTETKDILSEAINKENNDYLEKVSIAPIEKELETKTVPTNGIKFEDTYYSKEPTKIENENLDTIDENKIINESKSSTDFIFKKEQLDELNEYISSKLSKECKISNKTNYLSYNNSMKGPSIEVYETEDCYAIYLYCVLNEEATQTEENNIQIETNQKILKEILNKISTNPEELYNTIYNDYEIDSILSEETYVQVGNSKIKSELMQKYVIYYIEK